MTDRVLMKGNEAIAEGAVLAGCQAYFGYPITPQNEILEYMARRMAEAGRTFVQTESEVSAISMVLGASAAGCRAMTSTSSPGFSLQQEGISYLAGSELPAVIVNVMRGGPGLGGIMGAQSDYLQAVKGGGHGDYHLLVLAPASVQEAMDLTMLAFELADRYRNPVLILTDGFVGQVSEPVQIRPAAAEPPARPWAVTGKKGRTKNIIRSIHLVPEELEKHNLRLAEKYRLMRAGETRYEQHGAANPVVLVVAYGSAARAAKSALEMVASQGIRAAMLRPISLYPFPYQALNSMSCNARAVLVAELSVGQLIEDVRLAVSPSVALHHVHRLGGLTLSGEEIAQAVTDIYQGRARPVPGLVSGCTVTSP